MPNIVFKAADVRRVVEHSLAAPKQAEQAVDYVETPEGWKTVTKPVAKPAVILVHDDGVYLMSNGEPGDPRDPAEAGEECFRRYVAYAEGCDPVKDHHSYDTANALVGGDDFGETLPWAGAIKEMLDRGATHIVIRWGTNSASLTARYQRRRPAAPHVHAAPGGLQ
jgi:hypothetical protein